MMKAFSISIISLILTSGLSPDIDLNVSTRLVHIGEVTADIERTGHEVSIKVDGVPTGGELVVTRGSHELSEISKGLYEDNLLQSSSASFYTFSLETPLKSNSDSVLDGKILPSASGNYVELTIVSAGVPNPSIEPNSAFAATTLPSRTRFRYQTFIPEFDTPAPAVVCAPFPDNNSMPIATFLGDNRSWNPDSDSYKTRSDVVVDWSAGGEIVPDFSVGQSTQILEYIYPLGIGNRTIITKKTASSDGLRLVKGVSSSDYVSFHIYSDVTNPFCAKELTRGITYDFAFYVHRDGAFVVKGTLLRVPNHELYTRNNVNTAWRTLLQSTNQGFQCLFEWSFGCDVDKYIQGDLVP